MKAIPRQAGYSVAELVTAIALSTALAGSVAPVASSILNQYRLANATRQLGFEVARARMEAIGQNVYVRITLVGTTQYKRERSTDSGATWSDDGVAVALPTGFTVAAGTTGTPRFDRQGLAQAATTLTVNGPRGQQTLSVNILGRTTRS